MKEIKIGMIGLDTSHCAAFANLLTDQDNPHHIPGGRVVAAYPGGSIDFAMSYNRIETITGVMREEYGVRILDSMQQVADQSDAFMITSVDGRVHKEQFKALAAYGKPVFIDKPLTVSSEDAEHIFALANREGVPVMSCSSLRYAESLQSKLHGLRETGCTIYGADAMGPMNIEPTQGGLFWYGIHCVEMLYAAMGTGCRQVTAVSSKEHDMVIGLWEDGRQGSVRGNRLKNKTFAALLHTPEGTQYIDAKSTEKPSYAGMLEDVLAFFRTGVSPIASAESLEIIRFIEAANESRDTGRCVSL